VDGRLLSNDEYRAPICGLREQSPFRRHFTNVIPFNDFPSPPLQPPRSSQKLLLRTSMPGCTHLDQLAVQTPKSPLYPSSPLKAVLLALPTSLLPFLFPNFVSFFALALPGSATTLQALDTSPASTVKLLTFFFLHKFFLPLQRTCP